MPESELVVLKTRPAADTSAVASPSRILASVADRGTQSASNTDNRKDSARRIINSVQAATPSSLAPSPIDSLASSPQKLRQDILASIEAMKARHVSGRSKALPAQSRDVRQTETPTSAIASSAAPATPDRTGVVIKTEMSAKAVHDVRTSVANLAQRVTELEMQASLSRRVMDLEQQVAAQEERLEQVAAEVQKRLRTFSQKFVASLGSMDGDAEE